MAFLSKILFKPNKVLEILSFVYIFVSVNKVLCVRHIKDISISVVHHSF